MPVDAQPDDGASRVAGVFSSPLGVTNMYDLAARVAGRALDGVATARRGQDYYAVERSGLALEPIDDWLADRKKYAAIIVSGGWYYRAFLFDTLAAASKFLRALARASTQLPEAEQPVPDPAEPHLLGYVGATPTEVYGECEDVPTGPFSGNWPGWVTPLARNKPSPVTYLSDESVERYLKRHGIFGVIFKAFPARSDYPVMQVFDRRRDAIQAKAVGERRARALARTHPVSESKAALELVGQVEVPTRKFADRAGAPADEHFTLKGPLLDYLKHQAALAGLTDQVYLAYSGFKAVPTDDDDEYMLDSDAQPGRLVVIAPDGRWARASHLQGTLASHPKRPKAMNTPPPAVAIFSTDLSHYSHDSQAAAFGERAALQKLIRQVARDGAMTEAADTTEKIQRLGVLWVPPARVEKVGDLRNYLRGRLNELGLNQSIGVFQSNADLSPENWRYEPEFGLPDGRTVGAAYLIRYLREHLGVAGPVGAAAIRLRGRWGWAESYAVVGAVSAVQRLIRAIGRPTLMDEAQDESAIQRLGTIDAAPLVANAADAADLGPYLCQRIAALGLTPAVAAMESTIDFSEPLHPWGECKVAPGRWVSERTMADYLRSRLNVTGPLGGLTVIGGSWDTAQHTFVVVGPVRAVERLRRDLTLRRAQVTEAQSGLPDPAVS